MEDDIYRPCANWASRSEREPWIIRPDRSNWLTTAWLHHITCGSRSWRLLVTWAKLAAICIIITLRFFDKCQIIPLAKTFSRQFRILEFPYQSVVRVSIFYAINFPRIVIMCKNLIWRNDCTTMKGIPRLPFAQNTWSWTNISGNNRNAIKGPTILDYTNMLDGLFSASSMRLARALARWRPELIFDELKIITVTIIIKMIKRGEASRLGLV